MDVPGERVQMSGSITGHSIGNCSVHTHEDNDVMLVSSHIRAQPDFGGKRDPGINILKKLSAIYTQPMSQRGLYSLFLKLAASKTTCNLLVGRSLESLEENEQQTQLMNYRLNPYHRLVSSLPHFDRHVK